MAKIRNISGIDLIVPGLGGRLVPSGAVVDVEDDVADSYTVCESMWAPAKPAPADNNPAPADSGKAE